MGKKCYKGSLLQKIYNRQIFGQFVRGVQLSHEPTKQLFSYVPDRLIFNLGETIPNLGNHILMGTTRCGRLLLTYSYNVDSSMDFSPAATYRYRLHFWLFRPGKPAAKIGEVQLFDGAVVSEALSIVIVQWPFDNDRLLVYGSCQSADNLDGWSTDEESKNSMYVTMTTVPCLTGCENCRAVAASFDEEEMAAGWDCGVGLSCMRHGLTTHTQFTSPHVNAFNPRICLASNGHVVFNTGSFLHSLSVNVESGNQSSSAAVGSGSSSSSFPSFLISNPSNTHGLRLPYNYMRERGYSAFVSDDWACNMVDHLARSVTPATTEIGPGVRLDISQLPFFVKYALQRHLAKHTTTKCKTTKKNGSPKLCRELAISLLSQTKRPKQRWFSSYASRNKVANRSPDDSVENVYDFMESDELGCEPKFKLFRRRCKADKMYEFRIDEEIVAGNENVRPYFEEKSDSPTKPPVISPSKLQPLPETIKPFEVNTTVRAIMADWGLLDPETEAERREKVISRFMSGLGTSSDRSMLIRGRRWSPLKPLNKSGSPVKSSISQNRHSLKRPLELTDEMKEEISKGLGHQPVAGCSVKFTRRYIEVDQEITSTITDIEDDDNGTGFHCALPISAHGSSYSQMEMITNAKATKLGILCAVVRQESLDIEQFCFIAAQLICRSEGYRFWFCSDYDTEIVNVCYDSGDVLGVLFIRLNAEEIKEMTPREKQNDINEIRADLRNFYETQCLYVWSPSRCCVYLEGYRGLRRVSMNLSKAWSPASKQAKYLRASDPGGRFGNIRAFEPRLLVHRVDPNVSIYPLNLIIDHENLVGFRRFPIPSELDT